MSHQIDAAALLGAYALDAVTPAEREAVEAYLAEHPEARDEARELSGVAVELSILTEATPPAALREQVLAGARTVRPLPPLTGSTAAGPASSTGEAQPVEQHQEAESQHEDAEPQDELARRRPRRRALLAAAAVVLLGGGGVLAWQQPWDSSQQQVVADPVQRIEGAADAQRSTITVGGSRATIVRSASQRRAALVSADWPAAPNGRSYQLWWQDRAGKMHNAGVVPDGAAPRVRMVMTGDGTDAAGAGVTLEPTGGSEQPTSKPLSVIRL